MAYLANTGQVHVSDACVGRASFPPRYELVPTIQQQLPLGSIPMRERLGVEEREVMIQFQQLFISTDRNLSRRFR
jgi:hypothetical protein